MEIKKERYLALDVLRGLTVTLMIIVNSPGSWSYIYGPFDHAEWHGFTITDLVYPSFLFVIGNAMAFSMQKFEGQKNSLFLRKVFKRGLLIFLIGWLLSFFPGFRYSITEGIYAVDFGTFRFMGVLQRIALCYVLGAIIIRYFSLKSQAILSVLILLGYWLVMYLFGDGSDPYSLEGNAALKLDLWLFGADHLYKGEGIPFDPEGILSTFPATVNVIAGYAVGKFIQKSGNHAGTVFRVLLLGAAAVAIAFAWDFAFPINKKLWTSSYVMHTVGLVMIFLALVMYLLEVMRVRSWTYFFEVFGKNPLMLYVLSIALIKVLYMIPIGSISLQYWMYQQLFLSWMDYKSASLAFALMFMMSIWLIGLWMDKRKIYIKV